MGFWNTFVKVWQVRTSIRIQERFESSYHLAKKKIETENNLPQIINELNTKNASWEEELEKHRKKNG